LGRIPAWARKIARRAQGIEAEAGARARTAVTWATWVWRWPDTAEPVVARANRPRRVDTERAEGRAPMSQPLAWEAAAEVFLHVLEQLVGAQGEAEAGGLGYQRLMGRAGERLGRVAPPLAQLRGKRGAVRPGCQVVAKGRSEVGTVDRRVWWQVMVARGQPVVPLGREVREVGGEEMWAARWEGHRSRLISRLQARVSCASQSS
jgi:hypothetical protein